MSELPVVSFSFSYLTIPLKLIYKRAPVICCFSIVTFLNRKLGLMRAMKIPRKQVAHKSYKHL